MNLAEYAKGIIAIVGAGITAALTIFPAHTTTWNGLTIAAAAVTAAAVVLVPNAKPAAQKG